MASQSKTTWRPLTVADVSYVTRWPSPQQFEHPDNKAGSGSGEGRSSSDAILSHNTLMNSRTHQDRAQSPVATLQRPNGRQGPMPPARVGLNIPDGDPKSVPGKRVGAVPPDLFPKVEPQLKDFGDTLAVAVAQARHQKELFVQQADEELEIREEIQEGLATILGEIRSIDKQLAALSINPGTGRAATPEGIAATRQLQEQRQYYQNKYNELDQRFKDRIAAFEISCMDALSGKPVQPIDLDLNKAEVPKKPTSRQVHVPEWFGKLDKKGVVKLDSQGEENRFVELLNKMIKMEADAREHEVNCKQTCKHGHGPKWDKHWHEPDKRWATEKQRELGGWWKCPEGSNCQRCHPKKEGPVERLSSHARRAQRGVIKDAITKDLTKLAAYIQEEMGFIAAGDKATVLARMRQEKFDGGQILRPDSRQSEESVEDDSD